MLKGRGYLAVPPLFPAIKTGRFHQLSLPGSIDYPMVTEEAEPALTHKPSHPAKRGKSGPTPVKMLAFVGDPNQRFYNFQRILYVITLIALVKQPTLSRKFASTEAQNAIAIRANIHNFLL